LHNEVVARFRAAIPADLPGDAFVSLRIVDELSEELTIRKGVIDPPQSAHDTGIMITVHTGGGLGYAGTSDLSAAGIRGALERARAWAEHSGSRSLFHTGQLAMPSPTGTYTTPVQQPWNAVPVSQRVEWLHRMGTAIGTDARIVDWDASLSALTVRSRYVTNQGGDIVQELHHLIPDFTVMASNGSLVQKRSLGLRGLARQGGWELVEQAALEELVVQCREEAIALLSAPDCPSGKMHLMLDPGQMMLQIHESIGHPLELDRILGDERNYAGRSFVTPEMFGSYQYGSTLLNVTFDPTIPQQFASYGWDDEGNIAQRQHIIRDGLLVRGLGSTTSEQRSGIPGVASSRATSWNRPPIDRMANLNVEPGSSSFAELVSRVERGVYMETNTSWSIDDSRNKFQFGCELGRLIEDGELKGLVRTPNYRGISATFWRNLVGVGDRSTFQVLGTPYCGKGEPNQIIRVGHASPTCLFADVDVFGGA